MVNPDAETAPAFRKLEREFFDLKDQLAENRDQPAVTADGVPLELLANINSAADATASAARDGRGRRRLVSHRVSLPDASRRARRRGATGRLPRDHPAAPNHSVTIRTLDIGGDKTVPYLGHTHQEANPFMGWRSIRLSFEHPEFFMTQIRAMLRAAARRAVVWVARCACMFPMITALEEIHRVRAMVRRACRATGRGRQTVSGTCRWA